MENNVNLINKKVVNKEQEVPTQGRWKKKVAALAEVTGVVIFGYLLTGIIVLYLGLNFSLGSLFASNTPPDYFNITLNLTVLLIVQYGCILGLAFLVGYRHRKRNIRSYGFTTNSQPVSKLFSLGIIIFALASLPVMLIKLAQEYLPFIGDIPMTQAYIRYEDWTQIGFWLFLAVGSFGLVAVFEEILGRGYIQTRLAEDFGGPAAILISGSIFTFAHVQYLYIGIFGISNLIAIFGLSLAVGYLYYRTKSLIPSIIFHALINFPIWGMGLIVVPILMVGVVIIFRKVIHQHLKDFRGAIQSIDSKKVVLASAIFTAIIAVLIGFQVSLVYILGIILLFVALYLESREKKEKLKAKSTDTIEITS